ncbi:MAG TPA: tRNA pseudouridine(55) synthase TruB [Pirellulales bacterium]|jgi:tRNA pseudouridine55 synthase|nr:tRNA pseudouridine(55) synthase TruB [Pirellulales bacterium]
MSFSGLINVSKPGGLTSRAVVDRVQRLVRPAKAGHAGTLDPLATGVLIVCVGAATRLIEYVQRMPKRYTGMFLLGRQSPTEDIEGEITELADARQPTGDELLAATRRLTGTILQRPPQFSALKVAGRRAYDLARRGESVDLAPREVTIHECRLIEYEYPRLVLEIQCSSGTYVRSLGRDLAESVGSSAVMSALERTAIGHFTLDGAWPLERLEPATVQQAMLAPAEAVRELARIQLMPPAALRIARGQTIVASGSAAADEFAAFDEQGRLVSILGRRADGSLGPLRNLPV